MPYHIEYAKSGRAKCKGPKKLCHREDRVIQQGELRFGVDIDSGSFSSTTWKHWTCVTPKVIENMKDALSGPEEIEGFEDLRDGDADKVRRAWEAGEVPEEDRPQKEETNETEEKEKKETKKGGRKKKAETETEKKEEAPKKRGRKRKNVEEEEEKTEEKPEKPTRKRGRKKKTTEEKKDDNEQASAENE